MSQDITVTDQFCGAGGSTEGAKAAGAIVKQAMNHWQLAGDTYKSNHPNTDVDITDIQATNPRRYKTTDILITSPECTNHSLAKGIPRRYYDQDLFGNVFADPAAERSRATMWDVPRYAEYHRYKIVIVENVVDAAKWGNWDAWLLAMHQWGYEHEVVYYNSMFAYPCPQSRDRMYVVFWLKGIRKPNLEFRPPAYCPRCDRRTESIQTWKNGKKWGRYKAQYFYRCEFCTKEVTPFYYAAMNAIDWSIPAERIGDRKRPLKPKTLARVKYGLEKYGRTPLIVTGRYTSGVECRVREASAEPLPTQPGDSSHAIAFPWLVDLAHTKNQGAHVYSGDSTLPTATGAQSVGVAAPWLVETNYSHSGDNRVTEISEPTTTQSARQSLGLVGFLSKQYGGGADPRAMGIPLDGALGSVTTWDHHALLQAPAAGEISPAFIANLRGGGSKASGVDDPLLCVTSTGSHHALLSSNAFLSYYYGTHQASNITDPVHTMTGVERAALVGRLESMALEDLTFRMLSPAEIGAAMAFPKNYIVLGTNREKTKQFGNAVTPPFMDMLMQRCIGALI